MIKRIEPEPAKAAVVITQAELEEDRKRGFCVIEFAPAGEIVVRNPRSNRAEIRKAVPAQHLFRCMICQFDAVDGDYPPSDGSTEKRTGLTLIKQHLSENRHPWPYPSYESPYGNVEDVIIEGVEDYSKEIAR